MEPTLIAIVVLGLLALLLLGALGYVVYSWYRLSGQVTSIAAERDTHETRALQLEQEQQEAAQAVESLRTANADLERGAAVLEEQLAAKERERLQQVESLQQQAEDRAQADEKRLRQINEQYQDKLKALAADAMKESSAEFLKLAQQSFQKHHTESAADIEERRKAVERLVQPISETLEKTGEAIKLFDERRVRDAAALGQKLNEMTNDSARLQQETARLVKALGKPEVRGQYGEIQLQRVVELAGMRQYCDFDTQHSTRSDEGDLLRPDMVVRMPNDRTVVVDAKTNIAHYIEALDTADTQERESRMDRFAKGVLEQAKSLAKKDYWKSVDGSPEFTVMFIPGDQFIDAALQREPKLLELALQHSVLLASPSTLVGLLRVVAMGWQEQRMSEEANQLRELGVELHDRTKTLFEHFDKVGRGLNSSVAAYNKLYSSFDARLMPTLRKFESSGVAASKALPELKPIEVQARLSDAGAGQGEVDV